MKEDYSKIEHRSQIYAVIAGNATTKGTKLTIITI